MWGCYEMVVTFEVLVRVQMFQASADWPQNSVSLVLVVLRDSVVEL